MKVPLEKLSKFRWSLWISPIMMLFCILMMISLGFSEDPLFKRVTTELTQGQVPAVQYRPSLKMLSLVAFLFLFAGFFFQMLQGWARYYLNRKIVLSYLFFSIVPLVTTILIFAAVIRAWFGISSTLIIEKTMDIYKTELENFVMGIQEGIQELSPDKDFYEKIKALIESGRSTELSYQKRLKSGALTVAVYFQMEKRAGEPQSILPLYGPDAQNELNFIPEDTDAFEAILPVWLAETKWTDIVQDQGRLAIRFFSSVKYVSGNIIVIADIPIDTAFLNQLKEFQTVKITLNSLRGSGPITSDSPDSKWYLRLLLKPLSSKWDILAFNWAAGFYEDHGQIIFEVEPSYISRTLDPDDELNFFHDGQKNSSLNFILAICLVLVLAVLIAFTFGGYLVAYITRSLNVIALGHEKVAAGKLEYRLPHIGKDQLGAMGRSFNSMVGSIDSLMAQVLEKEKYGEELRIARDIQMSLLPRLEDMTWSSHIAATCIPALEVGGDYYEVVQAASGEIGVFIADVSGKGTSAAFYMAELKGVLIALRHLWNQPKQLLEDINQILQPALSSNIFISAAYLLLDPVKFVGKLARAGHCPAFHIKSDGSLRELMPPGMAIGIAKTEVFAKILKVIEFPLEQDDKIILYTDGLDEMTFHKEMFGMERLRQCLVRDAALSVNKLKDSILEEVLNFLSSETQNDDLTLVVASLPPSDEPSNNKKS